MACLEKIRSYDNLSGTELYLNIEYRHTKYGV